MENNFAYPIDHWSHSSLMMFLRNRFSFKKTYILKLCSFKSSPANIIGKAGHKALEVYYKTEDIDQAAKIGSEYVSSIKDDEVEWGKTGSREKCLEKFSESFNGYLSEAKIPFKILGIEKSITAKINHNGEELGLPGKSVSDLIVENEDGSIDIIDHKFVLAYTDEKTERGDLVSQAWFNYFSVLSEYGKAPAKMIFNEYKTSKNSNGEAQLQPYTIIFAKELENLEVFINIYNEATREISRPDCVYLPNFQDKFDYSGETFTDYKAQIITVESPIMVQHKTGDYQFKEKKFISSPVDIVDNENLPEEEKIRKKLMDFGIPVEMKETFKGSSVILYTLQASRGVKMSQFEKLAADLANALKAKSIRVQAPIMGTNLVGIEVSNPDRKIIKFFNDDNSINEKITLTPSSTNIPIGVDVYGKAVVKALEDMPHLLIAGATNQGKSVMINCAVRALAEQNTPDELKFVMIDPKRVELGQFKNLANLIPPIIFEVDKAVLALNWIISQMEKRYEIFEANAVRDIKEYRNNIGQMHRIVVVVDETADLLLSETDGAAEKAIIRLAQKGRAAGIHLILGTQRPSVDVISGLLKANFPTRIAFTCSSRADSQVILDQSGAEELTGKGDMLFMHPHERGLTRLQGFFV